MTRQTEMVLLRRWSSEHDAEAFSRLISLYADLVYSTCMRILRNEMDAQEVTQECFFRLAQSANEVKTSVGGWLHRVATTKSLDRLRSEIRRRERDSAYHAMVADAVEPSWSDIQGHVDEAIESLPPDLRYALVAHFFERKSPKAIARELRVSRRTAAYRVEKALAAVRECLRRKGIGIGAAALSAMLVSHAAEAAPLSVLASLGKISVLPGLGGAASGGTGTVSGVLTGVLLVNTKMMISGAVVCLLIAGAYFALRHRPPQPAPPPLTVTAKRKAPIVHKATPSPHVSATPARMPEAQSTSSQHVVAPQKREKQPKRAPGAESRYKPIDTPAEYASISGEVMDKDGYAIAGARVIAVPAIEQDVAFGLRKYHFIAHTDADGSYTIGKIRFEGDYYVCATKPGYAGTFTGSASRIPVHVKPKSAIEGINLVLSTASALRGRVLTATGDAVKDGIVQCESVWGPNSGHIVSFVVAYTQNDGSFTMGFKADPGSTATLRVYSPSSGSGTFSVAIQFDHVVELRLKPPATLYGVVRSKAGRPVANASLYFEGRRHDTGLANFNATTDGRGAYSVAVEPEMAYSAELVFGGKLLIKDESLGTIAPGERHEWNPVVTTSPLSVHGVVLGASTGKPIFSSPVAFLYVVCLQDGKPATSIGGGVNAPSGTFEVEPRAGAGVYQFKAVYRIAGADSRTWAEGDLSPPIQLKEGDNEEVTLRAPEPQHMSFCAVDVNGNPVAGAAIKLLGSDNFDLNLGLETGANGRPSEPFFLPPNDAFQFELTKSGYLPAKGVVYSNGQPGASYPEEQIVMQPAAGVEATIVQANGTVRPNFAATVRFVGADGAPVVSSVVTDANGHFVILDKAPAGAVNISVQAAAGSGNGATAAPQPSARSWRGSASLQAGAITNLGQIVL